MFFRSLWIKHRLILSKRAAQSEHGQSLLEYGLLLSLVGLVVLPILLLFGGSLSDTYQKLVCSLDGSSPACSCELYEVITKGPANVCVGGTFAFEALTSCGSNTSLSLYVEYDAGDTHDVGLSYEIPNDIFSTAFADNINLCETIRDGEVDARLVSRHHEDDIVNIFPISLSAGTVGMGPGEETPEATQDPEATELPEATEEPMTCPELLDVAFTALEQNCNGLGRHSACYGYNVVFATFSQAMPDDHFSVPSDRTELLNLYTLHTTAFAPEIDQWGIAMMNVQANLPNTLPGQSVVLLMVGDAEVENGVQSDRAVVPADPISIRTNYDTGARSAPSVNANIVATLVDNTQVGADGIDASGEWLRVWYQDVPVWLRRTAVTDSASLDDLPVLDAESDTPMEVFRLTTSPLGELSCDPVPNVLLVQNPESTLVTLSVNGTNVTIGSTVAMRTDQATGDLEVLVLDGNATVNGVALPSCHRGVVTGGVWTGVRGMTAAEQTEMEVLEDVPAGLLHYPVNVCAPATPPTPPPTLPLSIAGTLVATSSTCTRAIDWNGSNNTISGGVHSNRDINSGGSGNQIYGDTTYVTTIDSSGFVFYDYPYPSGAAGNSPLQVGLQSDPLGLNVNRFAPGGDIAIAAQAQGRYYNCNCKMDKGWFESQGYYNDATGELQDGVYYSTSTADDAIEINMNDVIGVGGGPARVTLVAPDGGIKVSGGNVSMEPYIGPTGDISADAPGILLFSNRQYAAASDRCSKFNINFSGGGHTLRGIVYAPRGLIELPGSNSVFNGALYGYTLNFNGSNGQFLWDGGLFP